MDDFLLEQIEQNPIVQQHNALFNQLCGLAVELRRTDGTVFRSIPNKNWGSLKKSEVTTSLSSYSDRTNTTISEEILEQLNITLKPQSFRCSNGYKKLAIPLVLNGKAIGILLTGESPSFKFNGIESNTLSQLLLNFTNYVIQNELNPLNISKGQSFTRQQQILTKVLKYIKENYHSNNLTLKDVASNIGISYHYLSRLFKKELKTSFAQFRNKIRMEAAVKLLKVRHLSIGQIAYACGFDDPAYFCKVFKQTHGTSPEVFRKQHIAKTKSKSVKIVL